MGTIKLDIDEYIKSHGVEVIIKGESYVIRDIPLEVQDALAEIPPDYKKIVLQIIGEKDPAVLDGYGIVALAKIVEAVHENLLPKTSREVSLTS